MRDSNARLRISWDVELSEANRVDRRPNKRGLSPFIYSRVGANFGEACVIPWDFDFAIYVSLTLIKQDRQIIDGRYLAVFLNSFDGVLQSRGGIMGSGIQNLNVDSVRKYRIPLPSIAEQEEVVSEVDRLLSVNSALEMEFDQLEKRIGRARQSILADAFSGALVGGVGLVKQQAPSANLAVSAGAK